MYSLAFSAPYWWKNKKLPLLHHPQDRTPSVMQLADFLAISIAPIPKFPMDLEWFKVETVTLSFQNLIFPLFCRFLFVRRPKSSNSLRWIHRRQEWFSSSSESVTVTTAIGYGRGGGSEKSPLETIQCHCEFASGWHQWEGGCSATWVESRPICAQQTFGFVSEDCRRTCPTCCRNWSETINWRTEFCWTLIQMFINENRILKKNF